MADLSFKELRLKNVNRCRELWHPVEEWTPAEWLMCLVGEVGELAGRMKHQKRGDTVPLFQLGQELADIQIYLDLLAASLGVDLASEVLQKFNIVSYASGSNIFLDAIGKEGEEKKKVDQIRDSV